MPPKYSDDFSSTNPRSDLNASSSSFLLAPPGYEVTECTDTNSTRSGIVGPGRVFGTLLSSAGRRVERFIDNFAEQHLALGLNMAALRLTAVLHDVHVELSAAQQVVPCKSEHMKDSKDTQVLAYRLLWVCGGVCSQCNTAYLPYVVSNPAYHNSGALNKALVHLVTYIRETSLLSNTELAAMYIHILMDSKVLSSEYIKELDILRIIIHSIDQIEKTHWLHDVPPDALTSLSHALASMHQSATPSNVRILRFDVDLAHSSDTRSLLSIIIDDLVLGQSANHWITRSVSVMRACTLLRIERNMRIDDLDELTKLFLSSVEELVMLSKLMGLCLVSEHLTCAYQKIQNEQVNRNALVLPGHTSSIYTVNYSPDAAQIASGSSDNTICIWNTMNIALSPTPVTILRGHSDRVYSVAYSPNGAHIVSGSEDNTVRIWNVQTGTYTIALMSHTQPVRSVAVCPNDSAIASGADDKTINIWSLRTGQQTVLVRGHTAGVRSVAFAPDGHQLLSGGLDKALRLWDVRAKLDKPFAALEGHTMSIHSAVFSPDGIQIVSGSRDKTVRVWDARALRNVTALKGHRDSVKAVAVSADGTRIISGSADNTVQIFDAQSYRRIALLEGHGDYVSSVAVSHDGRQLVSSSWDSPVRMWDIGRLRFPDITSRVQPL